MTTTIFTSILGFSLIAVALSAIFFSPYRHWLGFMFAGMLFWGLLETVRFSVQNLFDLSLALSYLTAFSVAMLALTAYLLHEDKRSQKALANRRYIEHTPVYDEE
ncbi:AciT family ciprofloxacin tolerance protein [Acinetobacter larvae]|uniref:Permease n=1 Tax=Acinetobacter larvae TaxID=1789224 RepID=A0A1B2M3R5_9GAMM|nr:AciT family ciprofloxacin tolerance protein [Acinetobacter larvae]AOA59683.1 hypothetical protein BFG52_15885 [Acinetobacter larvae]